VNSSSQDQRGNTKDKMIAHQLTQTDTLELRVITLSGGVMEVVKQDCHQAHHVRIMSTNMIPECQ